VGRYCEKRRRKSRGYKGTRTIEVVSRPRSKDYRIRRGSYIGDSNNADNCTDLSIGVIE